MPLGLTLVLLVFWLVLAYRAFQRGDLLLAGLFALVGVVLTVYRYRAATKRAAQTDPSEPQNPLK
jgi:hypothetical protein